MRTIIFTCLVGLWAIASIGCCAIMTGKRSTVNFTSTPPGARINIQPGNFKGTTPFTLSLKSDKYTVTAVKTGYNSGLASIGTRLNPWIWGNIFLGGLIGVIIDVAGGSSTVLDKTDVHIHLTR